MRINIYILLITSILFQNIQVKAQRGESVNQIVVVNSGKFEFTPPFIDYVTVEAYDPVSKQVKIFDTIYTQSGQDVVMHGHFAYVAAQDSIIKYDLDTYQRVAGIADSGMSKLCFYDNKLIVSKQYPISRFFVEILDENLALLAFVDGISGDCGGITANGDSIYVAVNHGWAGTDGRLAVINKNNWNLVRERQFGTDAVGITNLYNYDGRIFSVNKTPYGFPAVGSITAFNFYTGYFVNDIMSYTVGDGVGIVDNLLYVKLNEGIGSFNLNTQTIVDPTIVPDPGSISHRYILSACVDYVNDRLYMNIGNRTSNGIGVVTTLNGDSITSFPEGISADCLAVDYRTPVGFASNSNVNTKLSIFPNPFTDIVTIELPKGISQGEYQIIDCTGRIIKNQPFTISGVSLILNLSDISSGVFIISIHSGDFLTTSKLIKR